MAGATIIRAEGWNTPAARALVAAADTYIASLYGSADQSPIDAGQFEAANGGVFLLAYRDERPIGCGGLRRAVAPAPGDAAEIKRMFVVEDARRRGVAALLLGDLEARAAAFGYRQVVLDTGDKQIAAGRLYLAAGYRPIPGFSIYRDEPGNRAYAKRLAATPGPADQLPASR